MGAIKACLNGLECAQKCLLRELFLGLDIHAVCSDWRHMVMVLQIWPWPCRPWFCLHHLLRGTASCLSRLQTAVKRRRQQQMDSIQQVWCWRCRRTQTYTHMSMPQSGSESLVKSGRAPKQRACASNHLVTMWQLSSLEKTAVVRLPQDSQTSRAAQGAWTLKTSDHWGRGSWLVVRTSWIASLAVSFINCHLNIQ